MKFTSLDLELNQPSNRIIQIGAAAYCTDRGLIDEFSMYVDPGEEVNWDHTLNIGISLETLLPPHFKELWTDWKVVDKEAMRRFWAWHKTTGAGKKFIQWGGGDMKLLVEESQGCGYPSHLKVFDVKQAYKFIWQPGARLEKQSQLSSACKQLGVEGPDPAHCALQDAKATGRVMIEMFKQVEALAELQNKLGGK